MAEFIEFLSASALKELQTANAELIKMVSNVDAVGQKMKLINTPSGSDKGLKGLTVEYEKQEKAINNVKTKLVELSAVEKEELRVKRQLETVQAKITTANSQNTIALNTQKTVLRSLNGAYAELSEKVKRASDNYQNIIVRGRTAEQTQKQYNRELRTASNEFSTLQAKVLQADKAVGKWNRTGERSIGFARNLLGAFGVVGGVTLFAAIVRDVFNLTKEFDSLNRALALVTGTTGVFDQAQAFIQKTAQDFGVSLAILTKQYTQFYVAAKDKLSSQQIQDIFRSITKAGAAMGLSVQQQERAFLALNQMMSKGTIQAEELRGQLGEALPGALGIMAKAVGVNEAQLGKMMKAGELLAADVLPRFAIQLEKTYGIETLENIDSLVASQGKLTVAWEMYVASLQQGQGVTSRVLKAISDSFANILLAMQRIDEVGFLRTLAGDQTKAERIANGLNSIEEGFKNSNKTALEFYREERKRVEEIVDVYRKRDAQLVALDNVSRTNRYKAELETNRESLNVNIRIQNALTDKLNAEIKIREKLIETHVELNSAKQKGVSQDVLKNVAASKSNEILRQEITLMQVVTKAKKEDTESKKKNKKELKERQELLIGSVEWLEKEIAALEALKRQTATTNEEVQKFDETLQILINTLDMLLNGPKKPKVEDDTVTISDFDLSEAGLEEWYKSQQQKFGELGDAWQQGFIDFANQAQEAFALIEQASNARYEREYDRLERSRDIEILFAGQSATARAEIERQYDEKRRVIQQKQAKDNRSLAIFNTTIATAQAVVSALPNIPLSVVIGLMGAAKIALIASQQIPQFYKGTDNAPEGWAYTQERGAEIITDKNNKIKSFGNSGGSEMTYLNKGDKVKTASETMAFNQGLNNILTSNNISGAKVVFNGLSKSDFDNGISSLKSTIQNKEGITMIRDKRGERIFKQKQGQRIEVINNRLNVRGYDI